MSPTVDPDAPRGAPGAWRPIVLVAIGGTAGTAAREVVGLLIPDLAGVPVAVLLINLVGAFLLGALVAAVTRRGGPAGERLRLALGTGFCGGFTTYSALAEGTAALLRDGRPGLGVAYLGATLVLGALATSAGLALAAGRTRR